MTTQSKKAAKRDTVVFIPAWNEEQNLPAVLDGLRRELPAADVLVIDDGSTDRTAEVAREHKTEVLSFGENQGLKEGIAAGYGWALEHGYAYCGRVDADGQHPPAELARLLKLVRDDRCDVAVGSRFVSGEGYAPRRYRPSGVRRFGTALLRRAMGAALRRPFADATSGLYAVNAKALPLLAKPFTSEAPEVEALLRIVEAGLRLEEVPLNMNDRASGESPATGREGGSPGGDGDRSVGACEADALASAVIEIRRRSRYELGMRRAGEDAPV
jgi:glycosyltransferase involved in cell wall biosynthesis